MSDFFRCCSHCGCPAGQREGHDDTCSYGCNDDELEPVQVVHTHGPDEGLGTFCPERIVNGRLVGACQP